MQDTALALERIMSVPNALHGAGASHCSQPTDLALETLCLHLPLHQVLPIHSEGQIWTTELRTVKQEI